jgi:hypothetical protein
MVALVFDIDKKIASQRITTGRRRSIGRSRCGRATFRYRARAIILRLSAVIGSPSLP